MGRPSRIGGVSIYRVGGGPTNWRRAEAKYGRRARNLDKKRGRGGRNMLEEAPPHRPEAYGSGESSHRNSGDPLNERKCERGTNKGGSICEGVTDAISVMTARTATAARTVNGLRGVLPDFPIAPLVFRCAHFDAQAPDRNFIALDPPAASPSADSLAAYSARAPNSA